MNLYSSGMKSIVSEKGQVTIPKKLRQRLGLRTGVTIDFHEENGKLVGEKRIEKCPFEQWVGSGSLPFGKNTEEFLAIIRDR